MEPGQNGRQLRKHLQVIFINEAVLYFDWNGTEVSS